MKMKMSFTPADIFRLHCFLKQSQSKLLWQPDLAQKLRRKNVFIIILIKHREFRIYFTTKKGIRIMCQCVGLVNQFQGCL